MEAVIVSESITEDTLEDVLRERRRQDEKWGDQSHLPDGTGFPHSDAYAAAARAACQRAFDAGLGNWAYILYEEVREALAETDPAGLRAELIQVAAVAVAWVEAIDGRSES